MAGRISAIRARSSANVEYRSGGIAVDSNGQDMFQVISQEECEIDLRQRLPRIMRRDSKISSEGLRTRQDSTGPCGLGRMNLTS